MKSFEYVLSMSTNHIHSKFQNVGFKCKDLWDRALVAEQGVKKQYTDKTRIGNRRI